ncbi:SDR family oxidoreductase [Nitratireductor sp. CAU 1489]|uniref:SDR family oxidoreductase n=1 Tax=Nitratireductor arenosus TaxID=2682096 RepID=A0A844QMJ3_9HYPH|nr:SDR family oxidoreductase [Nitratireductor arenosus]MVA99170.1 SDR family oxidoreductase [Nitratireductor arenosus]
MTVSPLTGKRVLITAAGAGIGRACAERMAAAGAHVLATDIDRSALAGLEGAASIRTAGLDVCDQHAIGALVDENGPFDVLMNCAGIVHSGTIMDATDAEFDRAVDVNVRAMMRTIRAVMPGMLEQGDGAIVNIASVVSSVKAAPNRFVYATTKAAVIGLTKSVAADFVARGIRCNAICPGTVDSPSLQQRMRAGGDYEAARAAFIARQPMGRIGTPDEIADLALHLAGATFTTGQAYVIDGGWTA